MSFDQRDRLTLLENKVDVITKEVNTMLNSLAQTVINMVETHKLFTQFVVNKLEELEEAQGGKATTIREDGEGKEL